MVREPMVFLFDEPLSNLDAGLRAQMRIEIGALQRRLKTTTIYVTHDQVEAMTLGDRIVVLAEGRIQQVGRRERTSAPDRFVAGFIARADYFVDEPRDVAFVAEGLRVERPAFESPPRPVSEPRTLDTPEIEDRPRGSSLGRVVLVERWRHHPLTSTSGLIAYRVGLVESVPGL